MSTVVLGCKKGRIMIRTALTQGSIFRASWGGHGGIIGVAELEAVVGMDGRQHGNGVFGPDGV